MSTRLTTTHPLSVQLDAMALRFARESLSWPTHDRRALQIRRQAAQIRLVFQLITEDGTFDPELGAAWIDACEYLLRRYEGARHAANS